MRQPERKAGKALLGARSVWALFGCMTLCASMRASAQTQCDQTPILVRNAKLWSPSRTGQVRDVLFQDDRVASIASGGSIKPPAGARVIDGKGQTLLPGLIDLHLHFGVVGGLPDVAGAPPSRNWEITGRQLLRSGVTSGRGHMMSLAGAALLGKDAANPCSALPRIHYAGPEMVGGAPESESPNSTGVRSPEDAAAKVRRVAEAGLEWISIYEPQKFLPGEREALTTAARRAGIHLMGQSGSAEELEGVISMGSDTIDDIDTTTALRYPDALLRRLKELRNVTIVPSVGYSYRIEAFDRNPKLLDTPAHYEFMTPAEREFVSTTAKEALQKDGYVVNSRKIYSTLKTKFQQLLATGLPMATGSNVGSADHFHAGGIWWELEAWRAFGVRPHDAVIAATATGARVLHDERAGTLENGSHADFVLYEGDVENGPFELGRVRAVARGNVLFVKDGAWVGPKRVTAS
jgi:amidohydrolase family protein